MGGIAINNELDGEPRLSTIEARILRLEKLTKIIVAELDLDDLEDLHSSDDEDE